MKLLLTSNGIANQSIAAALIELTGKQPKDTRAAFIPTAANAERGNKEWLIKDMYRIHEQGYQVDIIDLAVLGQDRLRSALESVDIIFVGGGNTFYLSYWMQKSGLAEMLPELLQTKVYAGISAGSMVTGQSLVLSSQALEHEKQFKDGDYDLIGPAGESDGKTLNFTNLIFRPHLNSRYFSSNNIEALESKSKGLAYPVYALDDNSALKIVDDKIEVVSEGDWQLINPA